MGKNDKIQEAGNTPALLELQRIGANSAVTDTPSASMMFVQPGHIGNTAYLRHGWQPRADVVLAPN
jgi:hypothetical protein